MSDIAKAWRQGPLRRAHGGPEVMFAQVREDVSLEGSLAKGRCLCIASGGDTAFTLLLNGATHVTAVDVNPAQLLLVNLKISALRRLEYGEALAAMTSDARPAYEKLRKDLPADVATHFDSRQEDLAFGLQNCGKVDQAIRRMVRTFECWIVKRATVDRMLRAQTLEAQEEIFRKEWGTWLWRMGLSIAFSKMPLKLALGSQFSSAVPKGFAASFRSGMEEVLTTVPVSTNPYVWQTFRARYPLAGLPGWLQENAFPTLVERLDRMKIVEGDAVAGLRSNDEGVYDFVGLSNVLDGAGDEYKQALARAIVAGCREGSQVVLRSLFPSDSHLAEAGRGLRRIAVPRWTDRSFFCRNVELLEVTATG